MKLGIIGGSGLYEMSELRNVQPIAVETPFGPPSDAYIHGVLGNTEVYFLPRHGRGHKIMPSEINHKANIYGFKKLGVDCVIGVSAVGSLREELRPRDVVLPTQYFDRTKKSLEHTFFGRGIVAHIAFAEPICPYVHGLIRSTTNAVLSKRKEYAGIRVHDGGTYVNMEGPAFSTKAESGFYRKMDFDVIGMTSLGEAKLCREAEICYASLAMVTDYDCWHETAESVTLEMILGNLNANTALAHDLLREIAPRVGADRPCTCRTALHNAILTGPADLAASPARQALDLIIGKYAK